MGGQTKQGGGQAFATPEDLATRWHQLSQEQTTQAEVLLEDASQLIRDLCPDWERAAPSTLRAIACAMVRRAMASPDTGGGDVTQMSQGVGQVSTSLTYANPSGDLYLTRSEKRRLGLGRQCIWSIDQAVGEAVGS